MVMSYLPFGGARIAVEQPGQVTSTAHLEPLGDPVQRHRRFGPHVVGQFHFRGVSLATLRQGLFRPAQAPEACRDQSFRAILHGIVNRLAKQAVTGRFRYLLQ